MKASSSSSCVTMLAFLVVAVQSSPLNFPGSSVSVSSRVPNPCLTTAGETCVFPFSYLGVEYYQCTYSSSPTPWCATKVDPNGTVITNNWGDCANTQLSACPAESLTSPSCTAITGSACVFPFRHEGIVYNQCTEVAVSGVTGSQAWCSTNITTAGEHIAGSEAVCPNTCDGAQNNTATASTTTTMTAAVNTNSNRVRSNCVTVSG